MDWRVKINFSDWGDMPYNTHSNYLKCLADLFSFFFINLYPKFQDNLINFKIDKSHQSKQKELFSKAFGYFILLSSNLIFQFWLISVIFDLIALVPNMKIFDISQKCLIFSRIMSQYVIENYEKLEVGKYLQIALSSCGISFLHSSHF